MEAKELKQIEITCQQVNYPKAGKRLGSIKSSEGEFYGVEPSLLRIFEKGEVCLVEYTETPKKDGNGVWKNIRRKISSTPTVLANARTSPVQRGEMRPRTHPVDSEQMFVGQLLKQSYKPETTALELVEEINKLRKVWRNTFGGSETNRDDEMQDEIPY